MGYLDDFVNMSYSTNVNKTASYILPQLAYADTLPAGSRPRILGGVETNAGIGSTESYGDLGSTGGNSRSYVLSQLASAQSILGSHPSFCGMAIEDEWGWSVLNP
jgi:hypothetical protein